MDISKAMTDKDAFEFEMVYSEDDSTTWENKSTGSDQNCSPEIIDITIEDARNKKITLTSMMDSVLSLMRDVEQTEKVAEEAVEEGSRTCLDIFAMMDELKLTKQRAKEENDMHATEVNAQKAALATEMRQLQLRASGVFNEGDGYLKDLDEMRKSLEKRLASAVKKKEAADKDNLAKEVALANEQILMQKIVEESKRVEQEAMENLKLQEFLIDRGHVVEMLQEDISCRCQDVNLLKEELIDYEDENGMLDSESSWPIIQESISRELCKCWKCFT